MMESECNNREDEKERWEDDDDDDDEGGGCGNPYHLCLHWIFAHFFGGHSFSFYKFLSSISFSPNYYLGYCVRLFQLCVFVGQFIKMFMLDGVGHGKFTVPSDPIFFGQ